MRGAPEGRSVMPRHHVTEPGSARTRSCPGGLHPGGPGPEVFAFVERLPFPPVARHQPAADA
jgi:hypothetical protein